MTTNDSWRRYLEAGAAVGQATVARAEELAKNLFADDADEREHAWRDLDDLARFGRIVGEQLAGLARAEINRQLRTVATGTFERFFERVGDLLGTEPSTEASEPAPPAAVIEASVTVTAVVPDPAPGERVKKHKKNKKDRKDRSDPRRAKAKGHKHQRANKKDKSETNGSDAHRSGNGHPATERRRVLTLATPLDSATRL